MSGNLSFPEMTSARNDPIVTVVTTCKGDLKDPTFPQQLHCLVGGLRRLLCTENKALRITKLEPWNSVRVTFQIPREAAQRLRQLAQQGDRVLRDLGILSVQIEGDQVISLTIAGRFNEPQEIILRTDGESRASSNTPSLDLSGSEGSPGPSNVETTRKNIAQYLSQQGAMVTSTTGITASSTAMATSSSSEYFPSSVLDGGSGNSGGGSGNSGGGEFKSPNVVAPGSDPIPFAPPRTRAPGTFGPFPFASMTHAAINTMHSTQNHHQPGTSTVVSATAVSVSTSATSTSTASSPQRHPFSPPQPFSTSVTSAALALSQLQQQPPVAMPAVGLQPYGQPPTSTTYNNLPRGLGPADRPNVVLSSPLLVNLLQNDLTATSSAQRLSLAASRQDQKRKRKPRRPKDRPGDPLSPVTSPLMSPLSPASAPNTPGTPDAFNGNPAHHHHQPFSISLPVTSVGTVSRVEAPSSPPSSPSPMTVDTPSSSSQDKELSPWPSPSKRTQHLINPFTGQLEPMPSDDSMDSLPPNEVEDVESKETTTKTNETDESQPKDAAVKRTSSSDVGPTSPLNGDSPSSSTSSGSPGEKIKLRLKLDTKLPKELAAASADKMKAEAGASGTMQYKVDVSFVNIPTAVKKLPAAASPLHNSGSSGTPSPVSEPRVPPLHISLRGRNAMVVGGTSGLWKEERPPLQPHSKEMDHEPAGQAAVVTRSQRCKSPRLLRTVEATAPHPQPQQVPMGRRNPMRSEGTRRGRPPASVMVQSLLTSSTDSGDDVGRGDREDIKVLTQREKALLSGGSLVQALTVPQSEVPVVSVLAEPEAPTEGFAVEDAEQRTSAEGKNGSTKPRAGQEEQTPRSVVVCVSDSSNETSRTTSPVHWPQEVPVVSVEGRVLRSRTVSQERESRKLPSPPVDVGSSLVALGVVQPHSCGKLGSSQSSDHVEGPAVLTTGQEFVTCSVLSEPVETKSPPALPAGVPPAVPLVESSLPEDLPEVTVPRDVGQNAIGISVVVATASQDEVARQSPTSCELEAKKLDENAIPEDGEKELKGDDGGNVALLPDASALLDDDIEDEIACAESPTATTNRDDNAANQQVVKEEIEVPVFANHNSEEHESVEEEIGKAEAMLDGPKHVVAGCQNNVRWHREGSEVRIDDEEEEDEDDEEIGSAKDASPSINAVDLTAKVSVPMAGIVSLSLPPPTVDVETTAVVAKVTKMMTTVNTSAVVPSLIPLHGESVLVNRLGSLDVDREDAGYHIRSSSYRDCSATVRVNNSTLRSNALVGRKFLIPDLATYRNNTDSASHLSQVAINVSGSGLPMVVCSDVGGNAGGEMTAVKETTSSNGSSPNEDSGIDSMDALSEKQHSENESEHSRREESGVSEEKKLEVLDSIALPDEAAPSEDKSDGNGQEGKNEIEDKLEVIAETLNENEKTESEEEESEPMVELSYILPAMDGEAVEAVLDLCSVTPMDGSEWQESVALLVSGESGLDEVNVDDYLKSPDDGGDNDPPIELEPPPTDEATGETGVETTEDQEIPSTVEDFSETTSPVVEADQKSTIEDEEEEDSSPQLDEANQEVPSSTETLNRETVDGQVEGTSAEEDNLSGDGTESDPPSLVPPSLTPLTSLPRTVPTVLTVQSCPQILDSNPRITVLGCPRSQRGSVNSMPMQTGSIYTTSVSTVLSTSTSITSGPIKLVSVPTIVSPNIIVKTVDGPPALSPQSVGTLSVLTPSQFGCSTPSAVSPALAISPPIVTHGPSSPMKVIVSRVCPISSPTPCLLNALSPDHQPEVQSHSEPVKTSLNTATTISTPITTTAYSLLRMNTTSVTHSTTFFQSRGGATIYPPSRYGLSRAMMSTRPWSESTVPQNYGLTNDLCSRRPSSPQSDASYSASEDRLTPPTEVAANLDDSVDATADHNYVSRVNRIEENAKNHSPEVTLLPESSWDSPEDPNESVTNVEKEVVPETSIVLANDVHCPAVIEDEIVDKMAENEETEKLGLLTIDIPNSEPEERRVRTTRSNSKPWSPGANSESPLDRQSSSPIIKTEVVDEVTTTPTTEEGTTPISDTSGRHLNSSRGTKRRLEDTKERAPTPLPDGSSDGTDGLIKPDGDSAGFYSKPVKRRCSENAAELIKACMGLEDNQKRMTINRHRSSFDEISSSKTNDRSTDRRVRKEDVRRRRGVQNAIGSGESSDDEMTLSELANKSRGANKSFRCTSPVSDDRNSSSRYGGLKHVVSGREVRPERTVAVNSRFNNRGREDGGGTRGVKRPYRESRRDLRRSTGSSSAQFDEVTTPTSGGGRELQHSTSTTRSSRSSERSRKSPPRGGMRDKSPSRGRGRGRDHEHTSPTRPRDEDTTNKRKTRSSGTSEYYDSLPQKRRRFSRDHR